MENIINQLGEPIKSIQPLVHVADATEDPSLEEIKSLIESIKEKPKNKSILVLKQMNTEERVYETGVKVNTSKIELDAEEKKIMRPMYILAVSDDIDDSDYKPLNRLRASRITSVVGKKIECPIAGYKVVIVRDYDVMTIIES